MVTALATQLLPLDSLEINPFNCRACYGEAEITRLARSLATHGQLSPIKVRRSRKSGQRRYEVIYGHRRCLAARRLGWTRIRAEVVSASDTESVEQSLVENLERQDLSDYEKGMVFRRLNNEFGKTYEEIGALVGGLSKQRISSYVAMTRLFSAEDLASNPELRSALFRIDEHHARILSTIGNREARIELAIRTAREHLSVREVSNIVFRLRSWFRDSPSAFTGGKKAAPMQVEGTDSVQDEEKAEILQILSKTLNLNNEKKSDHFESFHLFNEGYSQFSYFPPMNLLEQSDARSRSLEWFEKVSASNKEILEQKIDIVGEVAVAALVVRNVGRENHAGQEWITRGTIVLVKKRGDVGCDENQGRRRWRTLHEHWSLLNNDDDDETQGMKDGGEKLETRDELVELPIGPREIEPLARL